MSFANAIMTLMQPEVFLAMMVGILGGMIIGILPGLGGTIAAALMMPLTYSLSPTAALVMLTTIYTSAVYGGSFTAILLHTPGTTASAATALDGYELTKQGKGLEALGVASFASVVGGLFSAIMLLMIAPSHHRQPGKRCPHQGTCSRRLRSADLHRRHGRHDRPAALHLRQSLAPLWHHHRPHHDRPFRHFPGSDPGRELGPCQ